MKSRMLSWADRTMLYRHLSVQVGNDRPVILALQEFKKRAERKRRKGLVETTATCIRRMQDGYSLADALQGAIPQDEVMTISSGDLSGRLPMSLDLVIESKERTQRVRRSIKSAMTSPAMLMMMLYGMMFAIGKYVVPSLAQARLMGA